MASNLLSMSWAARPFGMRRVIALLGVVVLSAIALLSPTAVFAQQAGNLWVQNDTAVTIRIGCEHYVDATGQPVDLNTYWDLGPGQYARFANGQTIVAQNFVFYIITPEGESAGWTANNVTAFGNLFASINNATLTKHKMLARAATSPYPPLTVKRQVRDNVARTEQRLTELNIAIPLAEAAVALAKAESNKVQGNPNATNNQKLIAAGAAAVAEASLNLARSERARVESDLRIMRDRLASLPD
jgi:hypothetical protein